MTTTAPVLVCAGLLSAAVLVLAGLPTPTREIVRPHARALPWHRLLPLAVPPVVLLVAGPVTGLLAALASLLTVRTFGKRAAAAGRREERSGAAEALAILCSELRAGRAPAAALDLASTVAVGPLARALHAAARSDRVGADPAGCLLHEVDASAVPEVLRGLAACWQVCASTGSSLAAAVERLAESLRADHAQRLAVEAELAGPRATALLLAVLPLAGLALAAGLGAHPLQVLLHTSVGLGCLAGGLCLDAAGVWWTGRLVASAGGT